MSTTVPTMTDLNKALTRIAALEKQVADLKAAAGTYDGGTP